MTVKLAALFAVALVSLVAASVAGAAHAGQVCPSFKHNGRTYNWETVGTGWSCASAKPWVVKLSGDRVHVGTKNVPLSNGPRGYHCYATLFSHGGRATSGTCFKGTVAFPGSGFAWNEA